MRKFITIRRRALSEQTAEAALALLALYADNGCATYNSDSELFRSLWGEENPPGFNLRPYEAMGASGHLVTRSKIDMSGENTQ
jgi:hypothetical protein